MANNVLLFINKEDRFDENEIVPGEEDWNDWPEDPEFEDDPDSTWPKK